MKFPRLCFILSVLICSPDGFAQNAALQKTVIKADKLVMEAKLENNVFRFLGNVLIEGTNLTAQCDEMTLISKREPEDASTAAGKTQSNDPNLIGQVGAIESLVAKGNVLIKQAGRTVQGGRARILPNEGFIEITDNALFTDSSGATFEGDVIRLDRGERTVTIDGQKNGGQRPTITLPPMQDLGTDLEKLLERDAAEDAAEGPDTAE